MGSFAAAAWSQTLVSSTAEAVEAKAVDRLPDFALTVPLVANETSVGTLDMPISGLRFEPRVDVQGRNLGEAQADVSIRGGVFESTGFKVGAVSLYDPQTGHYFAEIPVPPVMLTAPRILTGAANATQGFNAGAGTVAYGWRRIEARGTASVAVGDHGYNRQAFYQSGVFGRAGQLAADVEWARSEADGSRPFGEHDFQRIGGRLQLRGAFGQTDLFGGYQTKFFGWPNLYTPFGFNETENLQTVLLAANHRWQDGQGNFWQAGAYYRRNKDDYEFNRAVPGASNPFLHTTWTRGVSVDGVLQAGAAGRLVWAASALRDGLKSTSLTAGPAAGRTMMKLSVVPERTFSGVHGEWVARAGLAYDDADAAGGAWSPILGLEWRGRDQASAYVEYSEATQLPTYTALKSSATSGLFRGNAALGRETSRNLEAGVRRSLAGWTVEGAVFQRWDDDLVDWTYRRGVTARTANPVDIGVTGLELIATLRGERGDVVLGYTLLAKASDYRSALVDASFYALNYPRHRLTAALTWRFSPEWELRSDNEVRIQEDNSLRAVGGDEALISSLGFYYRPAALPRTEFSLLVDNLWDSNFEEVPAVPAGRRQLAFGVSLRW